MKKLGLLMLCILIIVLGLIIYIVYNDKNYLGSIKKKVIDNTEITEIKYINEYDNYYIVLDDDYLYLIDNKYNIILEVEKFLIHENDKKYDIIYRNNRFMYLNEINDGNSLMYEYYDIYTYEMIESIMVGGSNNG